MPVPSAPWRRAVPVAALALVTAAGLVSASAASADPLGPSGAAKGAPAALPAAVSDAGCTLRPSLNLPSETSSCIGVGATLSSLPALGQTATLTVTVKAGRVERATKVSVELPPTLAFADGTTAVAGVNGAGRTARATIATADLTAGATRTWTRTVKAVATGAGEITARALAVVSPGRTDGGADYVHLTVGSGAVASKAGFTQPAGDRATVATAAKAVTALPAGRASVPLPSAAIPSQRPATAAAPGTTCATGSWVFVNQAGATLGAYQTVVQVWRSGAVVASGYALGSGAYNLCWASGGTSNAVYVRFVESNNAWKVVTNAGNDYAYASGTQTIADGATGSFGTLQPADSTQMRALHAYYDDAVMYDWIYQNTAFGSGCWSPFASSCYQLVVHWQSDSTDGTYFNTGTGVHLLAASPDSEDEPVHEAGHALMYGLYGNTFPATTNCNPHYLFTISSTTCGWTEGWADWTDTSVWNNTIYTFASQSTTDFNRTWNGGGDNGDQVEGRVVQALDSINDGVKYPFDNIAGAGYRTAGPYFTVLHTYQPTTFAGFWNGRAAAGQDVSQASLSALYQGTIDYGFRNPLADGVGKVMPIASPAHNYSFTTTRSYWSAVAVRPADGSDSDLTLFDDAGQTSSLGVSAYGGTATDFVAINSNGGARALQTYYPRVSLFAGTAGYTVEGVQGATTLSAGSTTVSTGTASPIAIMDSYQSTGVPVYYRAVPAAGQSIGLSFLQPGGLIVPRSGATNGITGAAGQEVSLTATPSATGYGALVLVNQALTAGSVTLYADTSAPTGSVSVNGGAAKTTSPTVTLTLSGTDAQTGVDLMQVSTDGTFDTEPTVGYSTTATATLGGANGTKTVYVRYRNRAGMWSAPVSDTIKLAAKPLVTSLNPASGPTAGGTVVAVIGSYFLGASKVKFGSVPGTDVTVVNDHKITVTVPAGAKGAVTVSVTTPNGTSTNAVKYTYAAAPAVTALSKTTGPAAGGSTLKVTGTGFTGAASVTFGSTPVASYTVNSSTQITVVTPAHAAGPVHVTVTGPGGTSATTAADRYTFT